MAPPFADLPLLERIAAARPSLRVSERKVADWMLATAAEAPHAHLRDIANRAGVSEPTVLRFIRALGFDGLPAFRIALASALAVGAPAPHQAIKPGDSADAIADRILDHTIASLDQIRRRLDPAAIGRAAVMLSNARALLFIGLGASGIVARDAQQKFPLFGVPTVAETDAHQMLMAASMSGPGTVMMAISHTASSGPVVAAAEAARRAGAKVIALVGRAGPLTAQADHVVLVDALENTDAFTPAVSRIGALVMVDILATAVALGREPAHLTKLAAMKQTLAEARRR